MLKKATWNLLPEAVFAKGGVVGCFLGQSCCCKSTCPIELYFPDDPIDSADLGEELEELSRITISNHLSEEDGYGKSSSVKMRTWDVLCTLLVLMMISI